MVDEQPVIPETPATPEPPTDTPEVPETPVVPEEKPEEKEEEIDLEKLEPEVRGKKDDDTPKSPESDDDIEIDPEDEKRLNKILDKRLGGMAEKLSRVEKLENEAEVNGFIAAKPEFAKFKPAILKYMEHPAYKNIPAHNIAKIVAGDNLMKLGAQKEREAQKKAKETEGNGTTVRKTTTPVDWTSASKDDYEAQRAKVLGYQR